MEDKIALLGMTLAELKAVAGEIGMPSFAARQMAEWLYGKKVASIDEMTNISAKNRCLLNDVIPWAVRHRWTVNARQTGL